MAVGPVALLNGSLLALSRLASAAAPAAARSLREARRGPSGGRGTSSLSRRRRRRRRPGSQHGGGGGGGRGPGDGPRAGVRRGAALHQPLVYRRGRLRHGVVSVHARSQAGPRPPTPPPGDAADAAAASSAPRPPAPLRPQSMTSLWSLRRGPQAGPARLSRFGCCSRRFAGRPSIVAGRGVGGGGQHPGTPRPGRSAEFRARIPGKGTEAVPHPLPPPSLLASWPSF